jgi:hypothetical protein
MARRLQWRGCLILVYVGTCVRHRVLDHSNLEPKMKLWQCVKQVLSTCFTEKDSHLVKGCIPRMLL